MLYLIIGVLLIVLVIGPSLWVNYVLWKHSGTIDDMPGTGGELAQHLVDRFQLAGVRVQEGEKDQNHYDVENKVISLSPDIYHNKSLTAVAVATHEVSHAIQFTRKEPVSQLREKYLGKAHLIKRVGFIFLSLFSLAGLFFKTPSLLLIIAVTSIVTMLASVLMYVAILPEEFDASFNKALPILEEGYIHSSHLPAVKQVLRAAAYTYVAAALLDIVRLWRWLRFIR